jgi:hypothetical protein
MSDYIDVLRQKTRWDKIPGDDDGHRLLCSERVCSLSCANLRNGKISVTSVHGKERHSYLFTKNDMAFATLTFLDSLSEKELETFCSIFNKVSPEFILKLNKI